MVYQKELAQGAVKPAGHVCDLHAARQLGRHRVEVVPQGKQGTFSGRLEKGCKEFTDNRYEPMR